jgi:hypothetical protein
VANQVEAVRDDRFYVISAGPDSLDQARMRLDEISEFHNPSFPGAPSRKKFSYERSRLAQHSAMGGRGELNYANERRG